MKALDLIMSAPNDLMTASQIPPDDVAHALTRGGLEDGSLQAAARAGATPCLPLWSDREITASRRATLAVRPPGDLWVFGYGSLIWNPALVHLESRPTRVRGWRRRFCLASTGRGSPELPGLMLALDRGGSCRGVAFRLDEAGVERETELLWRREMLNGAYRPRWLRATAEAADIMVLTFVADRAHPRFMGHLSPAEIAQRIAFARGPLGSCLDYLRATQASLEVLGVRDVHLERVRRDVDAVLAETGQGRPSPPAREDGRTSDRISTPTEREATCIDGL